MKSLARIVIAAVLLMLTIMVIPLASHAQNLEGCAWPIELSPEGFGNATSPDTAARYWVMPFDRYETMTIKGTYPAARYFSFAAYKTNDAKASIGVDGALSDIDIAPDPGGVNPFVEPGGSSGTYTIVISRADQVSGNAITVSSDFAWVLLRVYVPDADASISGRNLMGGVPLPTISVTGNGESQRLEPCSPINKLTDVSAIVSMLLPADLEGNEGTPSSDQLWFAPPETTPPALLPNPDNKYIVMFPGDDYQPGRIIVIHGRAPGFPDTYHGSFMSTPASGFTTVDVRYWSVCEADLVRPVPTVACMTDVTTDVADGYYTIVISDDLLRPDWLDPDVNWMPWGDEQYPKVVFFRNMLPAAGFDHSVQAARDAGCAFDFTLPYIPSRDDAGYEVDAAGQCAQRVMGEYYPVAVWCDRSTFDAGGWQACIGGR